MKDIILNHVISEYGENKPKEQRTKHYSYCMFPEEECTCKDLNEITYDTQLISGGYIDSFSMVFTLVFLQKTFNIKIDDKDALPINFNTVNNMAELVKKYSK
jgi:acyl carrier protein